MNLDRYIKLAIEEAEKSAHFQRMGAVIFKGKNLISKGHNHSEKMVRSVNKNYIRWPFSIHAEMDTILKAKCDLRWGSMLVIRLNRKGELRYAKPCIHCQNYIHYVSLKRCWYSTSEGRILEL